jgi:hypothetical protein
MMAWPRLAGHPPRRHEHRPRYRALPARGRYLAQVRRAVPRWLPGALAAASVGAGAGHLAAPGAGGGPGW